MVNENLAMEIVQLMLEVKHHQTAHEYLLDTQLALEATINKYINLYNLIPVGHFILNKEGLIVDVNQAGTHLLGVDKNKLINRCFVRFVARDFQLLFSQYRQCLLKKIIANPV